MELTFVASMLSTPKALVQIICVDYEIRRSLMLAMQHPWSMLWRIDACESLGLNISPSPLGRSEWRKRHLSIDRGYLVGARWQGGAV